MGRGCEYAERYMHLGKDIDKIRGEERGPQFNPERDPMTMMVFKNGIR